ncbi:BatA domain-containing protein [Verrucomicrobiaceae bacterium 227]
MSFLNTAFLFAAAAVVIPIWLHLTKRRVFKEMTLGSLRFLNPSTKQRKKKARLEELPLLLLRVAALILLALIFARPLGPDFLSSDKDEPVEETVILLDASGSITPGMAEEARDAAEDAMDEAGDSKVTLAQFSDEVEVIESLDDYSPRAGATTRLIDSMEWVLDRFLGNERKVSKVVLISHLNPDSLPSSPPRVWPPGAKVELISLAPPEEANAAVTRTGLLTPFQTEEMILEAAVSIPSTAKSRKVTLEAEGLRVVGLLPAGAKRISFKFRPPREVVRGWVSVESDDPWPVDNRRPFAVKWSTPQKVLLIDGRPGSTPFEGQAYFLQKALAASGADHGISPFQAEIAYGLEGREGLRDLSGYKAIALCGVSGLSSAAVQSLVTFVEDGGGLVHFLDESAPAGVAALSQVGLVPRVISLDGSAEEVSLESWKKGHPAFVGFETPEGGSLESFAWRDKLVVKPDGNWAALAALPSGNPLLMESLKTERLMVCAHPMTREWSELPRQPLFVPLVKNIFAYLTGYEAESPEMTPLIPGISEAREPGIYSENAGTVLVAADSSESVVGRVSDEQFRASFGLPDEDAVLPVVPVAKDLPKDLARPNELWPWFALILLLLLIVENLLATRSPTPSQPSP